MRHYDHEEYKKLSVSERAVYLRKLDQQLGRDFQRRSESLESEDLPTFEHVATGVLFRLIPGGEFIFGLTDEEETDARAIVNPPPLNIEEMKPARWVHVPSFLITLRPIRVREVLGVLGPEVEFFAEDIVNGEHFPAYVQRKVAVAMAKKMNCRLPREEEWEYACRGGTQRLFVWGNKLLDVAELAEWLELGRKQSKANIFGLTELFSGDWCEDRWRPSHGGDAEEVKDAFVVKGGGSYFWPWQDEEWVWCMPSMRMPSSDLLNGKCAFRLVSAL